MDPRIAYYTGHFDGPFDINDSDKTDHFFSWKCGKLSHSPDSTPPPKQLPAALKQSLLLWSQPTADPAALFKLVQAVGDDVSLDEVDRELVYLTAAESFYRISRFEESFSQLRRLKASCLDGYNCLRRNNFTHLCLLDRSCLWSCYCSWEG